jgi:hypothetical protein
MDKPKREAILDLGKYSNERVRVKFMGGREGMYFVYPYLLVFTHARSHWHPQGL